jgi:preprotein translocase subunit SecE
VARQTRQQRRERRAQSDAGDGGGRTPTRPVRVSPEPAPEGPSPAPVSGRRRRGSFIVESWAELRKVEWPRQQQVIAGTFVVLVACLVVGFYLWGADQVFRRLVQNVLLK